MGSDGASWVSKRCTGMGFLFPVGVIALFCFIGIRYFRKTEKTFADNI